MKIDYEGLAKDFYDILPENERSVVALGMMPKKFLDLLVDNFKKVIVNIQKGDAAKYVSECDAQPAEYDHDRYLSSIAIINAPREELEGIIKDEVIKEFQHEVTVSVFKYAKSIKGMVV